jgi:hypothetical protein
MIMIAVTATDHNTAIRVASNFLRLPWRHITIAPSGFLSMAPARRTRIAPPNDDLATTVIAIVVPMAATARNPTIIVITVLIMMAVMIEYSTIIIPVMVAVLTPVVLRHGHAAHSQRQSQQPH